MVYKCCVTGCKTIAKRGLHSFPTNKLVAQKWIMAIKAPNFMDLVNDNKLARSFRKVCKKHFTESDFVPNIDGKSQLVPNSIPSLYLPEDTVDRSDNHKTSNPLKRGSKVSKAKIKPSQQSKNGHSSSSLGGDINDWVDVDKDGEDTAGDNYVTDLMAENSHGSGRRYVITPRKITEQATLRKLRYYKNRSKSNKMNDAKVIEYLSKIFNNKQQLEFVKIQIANCRRRKHGRRYTALQKSLCLAVYKQSPKNYRFMEPWWILPVKKTLGRHSALLLFKSGVNSNVLAAIKNRIKDWPENVRYCSFSWDEVSLKEHLDYCYSQDLIEGFVELDKCRQPIFATHSLTFMVRSILASFKQSIGYFYTNGLKTFELVELIKLMIGAALSTGLKPILSVCDQTSTNASAVNSLICPDRPLTVQTGSLLMYKVKDRKIIHSFDPSHLIKTMRNNFLNKNLKHHISERWRKDNNNINYSSPQIASWDHLSKLYHLDLESPQRCLIKLNGEHLKPTKLKMRVSLATQVFSNTCGNLMKRCIQEKRLPTHFAGTAGLLLFMNDVFDSMNGSEHLPDGTLKSAVKPNSEHFAFWEYSLAMLTKMNFVDKVTGVVNNRSSVLKKLESTIRGYMEFCKLCFELNITKVSIRNTSQDGLENFFGCVNSCNQNNKATPQLFRTGYGTMTINNITGTNSLRSNCERDESSAILTNIHEFILDCKTQLNTNTEISNQIDVNSIQSDELVEGEGWMDVDDMIIFDPQSDEEDLHFIEEDIPKDNNIGDIVYGDDGKFDSCEAEAFSNASNKIRQKLMILSTCQECKNYLKSLAENDHLLMTEATFFNICKGVLCSLKNIIPHICAQDSIKKKLILHAKSFKTYTIGCSDHNDQMIEKMIDLCATHTITTFCYDINSFLSDKTKTLPVNYNPIQKLAFDHRAKKKKIGKYTDIFN